MFFSNTAPDCSDPGIDFFFCSVFRVFGLSEVFQICHFFSFFPDHLDISSLSALFVMCIVFPLCIFRQLSFFLSSHRLSFFYICFGFLFKLIWQHHQQTLSLKGFLHRH